MGKFASTIRNITGIVIAFLLAHLGYKLYIVAEKLNIMCIKIDEMNNLVRDLHELIKNIKFSLF